MNKIFIGICILLLLACKKDESDIVFSGITPTNGTGVSMGTADESDWRLDDVWTDQEKAIFNSDEFITIPPTSNNLPDIPRALYQDQIVIHPAYPNPVMGYNFLSISGDASVFKLAIVNTSFDVLRSINVSDFHDSTFIFDVSDRSVFHSNTIYRVYYMFEYTTKAPELGHGDIQIME